MSLTVSGNWTNTQYTNQAVDITGLTFTVTYDGGDTATVTPTSISPSTWSSTVGTQTATFSYTASGVTVSCTKSANVQQGAAGYTVTFPTITGTIDGGSCDIKLTYLDGNSTNYGTNQIHNLDGAVVNNVVSVELYVSSVRAGAYGAIADELSNYEFSNNIITYPSDRRFSISNSDTGTITLHANLTFTELTVYAYDY